jgi:hypothetical protein
MWHSEALNLLFSLSDYKIASYQAKPLLVVINFELLSFWSGWNDFLMIFFPSSFCSWYLEYGRIRDSEQGSKLEDYKTLSDNFSFYEEWWREVRFDHYQKY